MSGRTHELSDRLTDGHANDEPSMVAPEGAFGASEEKSFKTFECSRGAEFAKEGHLFSLAELVRLSSGRLTELVTPLLSCRRSRAVASQPASRCAHHRELSRRASSRKIWPSGRLPH